MRYGDSGAGTCTQNYSPISAKYCEHIIMLKLRGKFENVCFNVINDNDKSFHPKNDYERR